MKYFKFIFFLLVVVSTPLELNATNRNKNKKPKIAKIKERKNKDEKRDNNYRTQKTGNIFDKAVSIYVKAEKNEDYVKAVELFKILVSRGVEHEDLYYNLGNAYYKINKAGYAVFYYEKALQIDPDHPDALYNLNLTKKLISSQNKDLVVSFDETSLWVKIINWFHINTLYLAFAIFWISFFALLIFLYFKKKDVIKAALVTLTIIIGLVAIVFGVLLLGRQNYESSNEFGIILPDEVSVKEAPQKASNEFFKVHAGLKVEVETSDKSWIKIKLPNGMEGWVETSKVGRL
ncbi:MAG: tetratricopeptide repeat protein [Myxococcota bacterium]